MKVLRIMQISLRNMKKTRLTLTQEIKNKKEYKARLDKIEKEALRIENEVKKKIPNLFRTNIGFFKELSNGDDSIIRKEKMFKAFEIKQRNELKNRKPTYGFNPPVNKELVESESFGDSENVNKKKTKKEGSSYDISKIIEIPKNYLDDSKEDEEKVINKEAKKENEDVNTATKENLRVDNTDNLDPFLEEGIKNKLEDIDKVAEDKINDQYNQPSQVEPNSKDSKVQSNLPDGSQPEKDSDIEKVKSHPKTSEVEASLTESKPNDPQSIILAPDHNDNGASFSQNEADH